MVFLKIRYGASAHVFSQCNPVVSQCTGLIIELIITVYVQYLNIQIFSSGGTGVTELVTDCFPSEQ